jgi:hypothetical protein
MICSKNPGRGLVLAREWRGQSPYLSRVSCGCDTEIMGTYLPS